MSLQHHRVALEQLVIRNGAQALLGPLDLSVAPGECVGLVGESGSGKSLTALTLPVIANFAADAAMAVVVQALDRRGVHPLTLQRALTVGERADDVRVETALRSGQGTRTDLHHEAAR